MRVGVFTPLLSSLPLESVLKKLTSLDICPVELGTGNYPGDAHCKLSMLDNRAELDVFKKAFGDQGCTISALSCHGNPLHPDVALAKHDREVSRKTILLAEKLTVLVVVDFSGCPGDSPGAKYPNWVTCPWPPEYLELLRWQWEEVAAPYWIEQAKFAADHGVQIAIEMHPGFLVYSRRVPGSPRWCMPRTRPRTGVLDTKKYTDERSRGWNFRTCGYGHDAGEFVSTLRMFGYDYVLSIEHGGQFDVGRRRAGEGRFLLEWPGHSKAGWRGLVGVMKRLKAVVFGTGFVGRVHIEGIRRLGSVEVYAIGVGPGDDAARLGAELYVERVSQDYRTLIADPEIDAVHVCTPNALHFPIVKAALEAGKHVLCEKPLAMSAAEAREMVSLALETKLRNCTFHNLRYYQMVQQARRMCEAGDLGEILIVQGTYSQDWLVYDTDWNWRLLASEGGASRCLADVGSHWCDAVEHVTGLRISSLCADLQTFHRTRKRPKQAIATFSGKALRPEEQDEVSINTEDFGAVMFRMGERTRGMFTASQVSAGRKNSFRFEVFGTKAGLAWDGERPDELWIGRRDRPNQILLKDFSLMLDAARSYADLPGGHSEGYDDTFKQVFRRFYHSIENPTVPADYPQFTDGLRQLTILEAELASNERRGWVEVNT